jgi:micrococcal nuclease
VSSETFTAWVIGVTTLTVLRAGRPEVIRLQGIDAPERGQAYGARAREYVAALAFGRMATLICGGRDAVPDRGQGRRAGCAADNVR